jgi:putative membrane protein
MKIRAFALLAGALAIATAFGQGSSTIRSKHSLSVASSANMHRIPPTAGVSRTDVTFLRTAAVVHMAEIQIGQLAQRNGATWGRGYGHDMEREHMIALNELKKLAKNKGVSLPTGIDSKHEKLLAKLSHQRGQAFDNAYRNAMIAGHSDVLKKLAAEMQHGRDSAVREYAVKLEPDVKMHRRMALEKMTMMDH